MNVLKGALLPVGCALLQTVSVGTGLPDRSPAAPRSPRCWGSRRAWHCSLGAEHPSWCWPSRWPATWPRCLWEDPALPVAVSVMVFVVGRGYTTEGRSPVQSPTLIAVALLGALIGVVAPLQMAGLGSEAAAYGLLCSVSGAAGLLMALKSGRDQQRRNELVMAERLRIARELHDVVGHGMGAITVQAGAARMAVAAGALDDATQSLLDIEAAGRGVLQEVRWLVTLLREQEHHALLDVPDLVGNARRSGLEVTLAVDGDLSDVPAAVGEAAYRIVQEAITNVLRHAPRKEAVVWIRVADTLDLEILDRSRPPVRRLRSRKATACEACANEPSPPGACCPPDARRPAHGRSTPSCP